MLNILRAAAQAKGPLSTTSLRHLSSEGETLAYQAQLLERDRLVEANIHTSSTTGAPDVAIIKAVTSAGHDYLEQNALAPEEVVVQYVDAKWARDSKRLKEERTKEEDRVNTDSMNRGVYSSTVRLNGLRVARKEELRRLLERRVELTVEACRGAGVPLQGTVSADLQSFLLRLQQERLEETQSLLRKEAAKCQLDSTFVISQLERGVQADAQSVLSDALDLLRAETAGMQFSSPTVQSEVHTMDAPEESSNRKVFIVHGHDEAKLRELKELLKEEWDLEPVVLGPLAGRGRTIIEKFEQEAEGVRFALVLLTPDDLVAGAGDDSKEYRPRPNVVFELGWFCGRLGRDRVCILRKGDAAIHSDLAGVEWIGFQEDVSEKVMKLREELRGAGLVE